MIEEIKKEVEHCFDGVYLEDKNFIIKTIIEILDKYKDIGMGELFNGKPFYKVVKKYESDNIDYFNISKEME